MGLLSEAFDGRGPAPPPWERSILSAGRDICSRMLPATLSAPDAVPEPTPLIEWGQAYLGHFMPLPLSRFHRELCTELDRVLASPDGERTVIAAPRGNAKTVWCSLILPLRVIAYQAKRFLVIIADTSTQAVEYLADIKAELSDNALLARDYPHIMGEGPVWTENEIVTVNGVRVLALGARQRIRGRRYKQFRPDLVVLDDLESDESVRSPEQRDKVHDWLLRAVLKAGGPRQKLDVVALGTVLHFDSVLARLLDKRQSPGWRSFFFQAIISDATRTDLWDEWTKIYTNYDLSDEDRLQQALDYYRANELAMLEGVEVLWPDGEPYYALRRLILDEGLPSFQSEKQNQPINPEDQLFNTEQFCWFNEVHDGAKTWLVPDQGDPVALDDCDVYVACDPSMGKQSRRADPSSIVALACWPAGESTYRTFWLIDATTRRRKPDVIKADLKELVTRRVPRRVGVESIQFQELLADEAREEMPGVHIVKLKPRKDKLMRIERLQPFTMSNRLRFSRSGVDGETIKHFREVGQPHAHDDGPDAVEQAFEVAGAIMWTSLQIEGTPMATKREAIATGSAVDQIRKVLPFAFTTPSDEWTCGNCKHFQPPENGNPEGDCRYHRGCRVEPKCVACGEWDAR